MTKNGAFAAEAVLFFNREDARDFEFRRKRFGHLISKMRCVSTQLLCGIEKGRWLNWAQIANRLACVLAERLAAVPAVEIVHPVEANLVFASMREPLRRKLHAAGAMFYDWGPCDDGRRLGRFVTSFATPERDIDRLFAACA